MMAAFAEEDQPAIVEVAGEVPAAVGQAVGVAAAAVVVIVEVADRIVEDLDREVQAVEGKRHIGPEPWAAVDVAAADSEDMEVVAVAVAAVVDVVHIGVAEVAAWVAVYDGTAPERKAGGPWGDRWAPSLQQLEGQVLETEVRDFEEPARRSNTPQ